MPHRKIAERDDLWDGEMRGLVVDGTAVLLVSLDGCVHAYEDRCAHLGVPLSDGMMEHGVITCSAHQYEYDARTGRGVNPATTCLRRFAARVDAEGIWVDLDTGDAERVGPVLEASDAARAVIAAIHVLNDRVEVVDRGAYLRVLVPARCVVTRAAVEDALGRPFRLPGDLELLMPSFKGKLTVGDDEAVWEATRPPSASGGEERRDFERGAAERGGAPSRRSREEI